MTEGRLIEIIKQHGGYESQTWVSEAMKQAVNEVLEKAAENVSITLFDYIGTSFKRFEQGDRFTINDGSYIEVDKQSILNLKVK